jgi:MFS transporter, YNFM family, putative membrane transport protein
MNLSADTGTRPVVPLIFSTVMIVFCNMYLTQPVLPIVGQEFGLTPAETGLTVSSLVLALAVGSPFFGLLSDRIGRKVVMVASMFALSVPTLLCGLAPGFGWLVAFRALQGAIIPGFTAVAVAYLQEEMPPQRRLLAVAYYISGTVTGGFLSRLFGGLLTEFSGSWRVGFILFALVDVIVATLLWKMLPDSRNFARNVPLEAKRFNFAIWEHLTNRPLLGAYLTGFCLMYAFLGLFTYLSYYLASPPFDLPLALLSFAYVTYLIGVWSSPLAAKMVPRWGRRGTLLIGFAIMWAGALITVAQNLLLVIVGLFVLCFGMFACQSTATALPGEYVKDARKRGSATALYQMFYYGGASCGGFLPGLLYQAGGWLFVVGGITASVAAGVVAVVFLCKG